MSKKVALWLSEKLIRSNWLYWLWKIKWGTFMGAPDTLGRKLLGFLSKYVVR